MTIPAVVVPDRRPDKPGEFQWRVAGERGECRFSSRPARPGETPNEMWLVPPGKEWPMAITLSGHPFPAGDTWEWDGNREAPTLTPSIVAPAHGDFPGWHGWLRAGKLVDA